MSTATIDYTDFQPDWWDGVGATAEAVKAGIESVINGAFGVGGVSEIQKQALIDAGYQQYQMQQAMKAAGAAAQQAAL